MRLGSRQGVVLILILMLILIVIFILILIVLMMPTRSTEPRGAGTLEQRARIPNQQFAVIRLTPSEITAREPLLDAAAAVVARRATREPRLRGDAS